MDPKLHSSVPLEGRRKAVASKVNLNKPFKSPLVTRPPKPAEPVSEEGKTSASDSTSEKNTHKPTHDLLESPVSSQASAPKRIRLTGSIRPQNHTLEELNKREAEVDQEISLLESNGLAVEELDHQIDLLHRYNDMKDAAQIVMGRLAELTGVTVKSLHLKYGLPLGD